MNYYLIIFVFIQSLIGISCYTPSANSCFLPKMKMNYDNRKVLKKSLSLLRASIYNKNKWEPPEGYIPDKYKDIRWEPPKGYVPDRLKTPIIIDFINKEIANYDNKDELYSNEGDDKNIEIEIDKILIKIEKIKNNVKNIKKYNKKEY